MSTEAVAHGSREPVYGCLRHAVFIGGCGRSGTTLLGAMLGAHERCVATPESRFISSTYKRLRMAGDPVDAQHASRVLEGDWGLAVWGIGMEQVTVGAGSYSSLIEDLVDLYSVTVGKVGTDVWIDHTPGNANRPHLLRALFPDSRYIHLVRDGRATAASVLPLDWGPNTVYDAARWWSTRVTRGLAAEAVFGPDQSLRVRFEDLVTNPTGTLTRICNFVGIEFQPRMNDGGGFDTPRYTRAQHRLVGGPPDPARLTAWMDALTPRQVEIFEYYAWQDLLAFGYDLALDRERAGPSVLERVGATVVEVMRDRVVNRMRNRRRRALAESLATDRPHDRTTDSSATRAG